MSVSDLVAPDYCNVDLSITLAKAQAIVLRAPIDEPVRTSFGVMTDRPALFVRIEDSAGNIGLGEVWCNFPACGAEHRANLLDGNMFPAIVGGSFNSPEECFRHLQSRFERLAIQTGEAGPLAQCIAGIDIALWDLVARRAGVPLFRLFGGFQKNVKAYASGINPEGALATVKRARKLGFQTFKLKIGFDYASDLDNISAISSDLEGDETLALDANQAWDLDTAIRIAQRISSVALAWLEEPLMATAPHKDWLALADAAGVALAGGENIIGEEDFAGIINAGWLDVIQPDLCKWGGFSGVLPVARQALAVGKRYCPHFLGGGVGLAASAHILAAVGGDGLLEIDINRNPLRQNLFSHKVVDGNIMLTEQPGLGIEPDALSRLARAHGVAK